jgi:hypothetical protein
MMDLVIMCSHVPHGRIVAAEGYAAGLAGAQMHPSRVHFDAFLANVFFSGLDIFDCTQMLA